MSTSFKVIYNDGHTDIAEPTIFDQMAAEKYCVRHDIGNSTVSPIANAAYMAYSVLRTAGKVMSGQSFDNWARAVNDIEVRKDVSDEADTDAEGRDNAPLPSGLPEASVNSVSPLPPDSAALPGSGDANLTATNGTGALL